MSDRARVTLRIAVPRERAFEVFTREIDRWWRRGKRFRVREDSTLSLEPRVGGRLRERHGARAWDTGEVLVWEPPRRLVLAWRAINFKADDPSTEVEVTFERAIGHAGKGTLVTLEHRGWSRVRPRSPCPSRRRSARLPFGHRALLGRPPELHARARLRGSLRSAPPR